MITQRAKNSLKVAGALVLLGLFMAVMLLGPALRTPVVDDSIHVPAMTNVPPPGSLHIETETSTPGATEAAGSR